MVQKRKRRPKKRVSVAQTAPRTVGKRLAAAIAERFGSERSFEQALRRAAPKLRGTSRNTIRSYLRDDRPAPAGWIRQAANVLSVRLEWLVTGDGERTEAEEAARRARPPETPDALLRHLDMSVPFWSLLGEPARTAVIETWKEIATASRVDVETWRKIATVGRIDDAAVAELVAIQGYVVLTNQLGAALAAPLEKLKHLSQGPIPARALNLYTVLLCEGLRQYTVAHREAETTIRASIAKEA